MLSAFDYNVFEGSLKRKGGENGKRSVLREQLLTLLQGGNAHDGIAQVTADFPIEHINRKPLNVEYSFWQLLEHMRITQWDILEFVRDPQHVSPQWPEGYWPSQDEEVDEARWKQTIQAFEADLKAMQTIVSDSQGDLDGRASARARLHDPARSAAGGGS
jgi:hypothetical protein